MSIKEIAQKIKSVREYVDLSEGMERNSFVAALILLLSVASFGLGRLSGLETAKNEVSVEFPENSAASEYFTSFATSSAPQLPSKKSGIYLASKNGTKYYLPSCKSSARIAEKNRVWFDTKEEAENAGYEPAANCAGL